MAQSNDNSADAEQISDEVLENILSITGVYENHELVRLLIRRIADIASNRASRKHQVRSQSQKAALKLVAGLSDELRAAIWRLEKVDCMDAVWFTNDDDDDDDDD